MFVLAISPGQGFHGPTWKAVLDSGIDGLLIREYQLQAKPLLDLVRRVQDLAPALEGWVAGRLDVALAAGCGLHAPEAYPEVDPGLAALSRPLHAESQWESRRSCAQLLVSPVFPAPGKGAPWGLPRLHRFLDQLPADGPRVLALGGIAPANAHALAHPRLAGVALIRALWESRDPSGVVEALRAGAGA
jgi:thiamine monophosphate synthase